MGHSELWPTSYSRQGCAWNGACNVPSRMLWPTSFEGPCWGNSSAVGLSGMNNLKAFTRHLWVWLCDWRNSAGSTPENHALAWWLQRLPRGIPDGRIWLCWNCQNRSVTRHAAAAFHRSRMGGCKVYQGLSVTSASVTSLPQFQLPVGVFFLSWPPDELQSSSTHFFRAEVKRNCNSTTYCSVKIVKLTLAEKISSTSSTHSVQPGSNQMPSSCHRCCHLCSAQGTPQALSKLSALTQGRSMASELGLTIAGAVLGQCQILKRLNTAS